MFGSGAGAILSVVLAVTPVSGGLLLPPAIPINTTPGDQLDPHVDGDFAAYTNVNTVPFLWQQIRYYSFTTGVDRAIPQPTGELVSDLLSDIDRDRIGFTRMSGGGYAIKIFDINTQVTTEITNSSSFYLGLALGNQTVAFIDTALHQDGELVVSTLPAGTPQRLTNDANFDFNPAVSPDGNVVVWEHCPTVGTFEGCDINAAVRSAGGGWDVRQLTNTPLLLESSPDSNGTVVVFDRRTGSSTGSDIVVVPVGGGAETVLEIPGEQYHPSIRGQFVAFEGRVTAASLSDIYLVNLATLELFQITSTPGFSETLNDVAVLSDGRVRLVWQANDELGSLGNIYGSTFVVPSTSTPDAGTGGGTDAGVCLTRTVALEATRFHSPTRSVDGVANFSPAFSFAIPSAIPVVAGNSGNKKVVLTIETSNGALRCVYRGGSSKAHPNTPAELALASRYLFERCHRSCGNVGHDDDDDHDDHHGGGANNGSNNRLIAGSIVTASSIRLHVQNGDTSKPKTQVRIALAEACNGTSSVSQPLDAQGGQAAGCSSTGTGVAPFLFAVGLVLLMLRRTAAIALVTRQERRRLQR